MPAKKPAPSTKPLWSKLGVKPEAALHLVSLPADFDRAALEGEEHTVREGAPKSLAEGAVLLAFAESKAQLPALAKQLKPLVEGDPRIWIAYPKGGKADFNRDTGWEPIRALGLDTVSQVALDERWSALRFRNAEHIGK